MAKRSPPMPQLCGSTTPSVALAAMAASMADPPRASTWAPACDARVWLVATMPRSEMTMERAWERSCAGARKGNPKISSTIGSRMHSKSYQLSLVVALFLASCAPRQQAAIDPDLEREIGQIRAIDNHAH